MELPKLPGLPSVPSLGEIPPMTSPTLAAGSFACGPNDEVATADIYKLKSAMGGGIKPITSIQELNASIPDATFKFALTPDATADFMSVTQKGEAVFDKDLLTARILGTSSEFKASFNELNDQLKKGALANTFKDKASSLMCTVNDVKSSVDSANIGSVKALGSFVNSYTGKPIFSGQDKGAIAGLLGSVVNTSSKLGITGAFSAIASTVNDNGILGRVTRAVLPMALKNSDTKLLRELSSSNTGKLINVFSPGFTQNFSRGFTYRGDRGGTTLTQYEDIFHSFENVDSQWNVLNRGEEGNSALNLMSIVGGSRDFQNLVMTGVKYWETEKRTNGTTPPVITDPMMILAGVFQEVTVGQAIKRDFPKVALLSVYNDRIKRGGLPAGSRNALNSNYMDPRTIKGTLGALFGY